MACPSAPVPAAPVYPPSCLPVCVPPPRPPPTPRCSDTLYKPSTAVDSAGRTVARCELDLAAAATAAATVQFYQTQVPKASSVCSLYTAATPYGGGLMLPFNVVPALGTGNDDCDCWQSCRDDPACDARLVCNATARREVCATQLSKPMAYSQPPAGCSA